MGNLIGLVLEPWSTSHTLNLRPGEIVLYMSTLPLICMCAFAKRAKEIGNKYAFLLLIISVLTLLTMSNFKTNPNDPASVFQRLFAIIIPTLHKIEVLENFGALFFFCLTLVAATGFKNALQDKGKSIWIAALALLALRFLLVWPLSAWGGIEFVEFIRMLIRLVFPRAKLPVINIYWMLTGLTALTATFIARYFECIKNILMRLATNGGPLYISMGRLRLFSILLLFLDMFIFNWFHINTSPGTVVGAEFYTLLKEENLLRPKTEESFINYRQAFIESSFYTFFGREILSNAKVAMPGLVNQFFGNPIVVDNIFSTRAYYDHLVNVDLDKQLATAGVIYPILNFFPSKDAIFVRDTREAVRRINEMDLRALGKHIVIENIINSPAALVAVDYKNLFSPKNLMKPSRREIASFESAKTLRFPANRDFHVRVTHFDQNSLSAVASSPEDGYFYFADGYSKHWKAFLDGRPVKIEKTNVAFKSVYMPKGKHRVDFVYDPASIRYAIYASGIGSLMAAVLAGLYIRRYS